MPLYLDGNESISITVPTGRISGSAAATPLCTATPDAVTRPLQYAVALNARRDPGSGGAEVSWTVASRAAYFESRAVTSYSDTNPTAATAVTIVRRQKPPEMIMAEQKGSKAGGQKAKAAKPKFLPCCLPAFPPCPYFLWWIMS